MGQKKQNVTVELNTPELRAAYNAWVAGKAAKDAAQETMDQASAILAPVMRDAGANVATIAGQTVLRLVSSVRVTFDSDILRKLAPSAAAKAEKKSPFDYIRKA